MSYQEITGTLNANQHGSYTTQDAFGDLLVTDVLYRQRTSKSNNIGQSGCVELYARSTSRGVRERERERVWILTRIMWYAGLPQRSAKDCRGFQLC